MGGADAQPYSNAESASESVYLEMCGIGADLKLVFLLKVNRVGLNVDLLKLGEGQKFCDVAIWACNIYSPQNREKLSGSRRFCTPCMPT